MTDSALPAGPARPWWLLPAIAFGLLFAVVGLVTLRPRPTSWTSSLDAGPSAPGPGDQRPLPPFRLLERSGRTITDADFRGKVAVVGFVFTRCHDTCLVVAGAMANLRDEIPKEVQFASISVDPRYDRPDVLRVYADNLHADADSWWFLTGERDDIHALLKDGFRVPISENPDPRTLPGELVTHTTRLAVLDKHCRVAGYFLTSHPDMPAALAAKVQELLKEPGP